MEIEKGMYVRFNGFISKIGHINISKKGNTYVQFKQPNGLLAHTRIENIDRASFNIIDLIEVGDYVNGEKVTRAESVDKNDTDRYLGFGDYDYYIHDNEDIKDIVTKEQFNSCKYVIERDKQMNEETVSFLNNIDFENTAEVYETISILFEKNQVLKKAIKEGVIATCETCEDFGICPHSYREYDYKNEVEELKNQQKEFINFLNNMIIAYKRAEKEYGNVADRAFWIAFETALSKYKEIIGGK